MTAAASQPQVHGIFDPATSTVTYVVHMCAGSACAIIDSVLDYDTKSGRTSHASADKTIAYVQAHELKLAWILETHAHADQLTAAPYLKALRVPGHTPACVAYQFGDAVFTGDTLFMPDVGTARCDFPGGDARALYAFARRLLSLPPKEANGIAYAKIPLNAL